MRSTQILLIKLCRKGKIQYEVLYFASRFCEQIEGKAENLATKYNNLIGNFRSKARKLTQFPEKI